jgi:L,D-transpeptidase catalytic domain
MLPALSTRNVPGDCNAPVALRDCHRRVVFGLRALLRACRGRGRRQYRPRQPDHGSQRRRQPRYNWRVSTARHGYITPPGTYRPQMMARRWFSRLYYNSPMPYSIFFHGGYAIHGTYEISRLGGPASHGCVRLDPDHAAILFELVEREGMSRTTIVVH